MDNASADGSPAMVAGDFPTVELVSLNHNVGFARAANEGARRGRAPYLFFLNPDATVDAATVPILVRFLADHPGAAVVGPRVVRPDGTLETTMRDEPTASNLLREHIPFAKRKTARFDAHERRRRCAWLVGAALMVRRAAYDAVGGFDENFPLYYEDADLCLRLGDAGHEVWLEPAARLSHVGAASALSTFGSRERIRVEYVRARSRLISKRRGGRGLFSYRLAYSALLGSRWFAAALRPGRAARAFQAQLLAALWGK